MTRRPDATSYRTGAWPSKRYTKWTKRNIWPYAGLAVIQRSSADQEYRNGKLQRSRKPPITRGLNRNHNPLLKSVFKGAATAAAAKAGPLREYYEASLAREE